MPAPALFWLSVVDFILWVLGLVSSAIGYGGTKEPGNPGRALAITITLI